MIDIDKWADNLLQEIYYAPENHRVALIADHLWKAVRRGFTDGSDNGWIATQEADITAQSVKSNKLDINWTK